MHRSRQNKMMIAPARVPRRIVISATLFVILSLCGFAMGAESSPEPDWLQKEPIVMVGNWDSISLFHDRLNGKSADWDKQYADEQSENTIRELHDRGVTLAIIHFFKGFGLKAEEAHIADATRMAVLLKKYGIRVGVYVGSTIFDETFLVEKPEAADWFVPAYLGKPVVYPGQPFRKRVYFMVPGYREYIKEVLRIAIEDLHADLIHFDNTGLRAQPAIFHHPQAIRDFREYLTQQYSSEELLSRFKVSDASEVTAPSPNGTPAEINDPLTQEWTTFRCLQIDRFYAEMSAFIRHLNPNVAIDNNPHHGMSGHNTVWEQGIDYPELLPPLDAIWTEENDPAGVTGNGILVSKIRTYKMAKSLGKCVFTYTAGSTNGKLQLAEAMAFNRQNLGMIGHPLEVAKLPADQLNYIRFFHDHFAEYQGLTSIAEVAVLHSRAAMGFNNGLPWQSTFLLEQTLIQEHIPFDIVFDDQLADLSRYRVLAIADQDALTDLEISRVNQFVRKGGGLFATEETSLRDERRQLRADFGLRDLFGPDVPLQGAAAQDKPAPPSVRREVEHGRVAYLSSIHPKTPKPANAPMVNKYWQLPLNVGEIADAIRWAAGGKLSVEVDAPATTVIEQGRHENGDWVLHLINYDNERHPSLERISVTMTMDKPRPLQEIVLISPDQEEQRLDFHQNDTRIEFIVPRLETYDLVRLHFK